MLLKLSPHVAKVKSEDLVYPKDYGSLCSGFFGSHSLGESCCVGQSPVRSQRAGNQSKAVNALVCSERYDAEG